MGDCAFPCNFQAQIPIRSFGSVFSAAQEWRSCKAYTSLDTSLCPSLTVLLAQASLYVEAKFRREKLLRCEDF